MSTIYTLKPVEGDNQDPVIVETGLTSEFRMSVLVEHMKNIVKCQKELKAQIELECAKMTNIETHHPLVLELTPEQQCAVALYAEVRGVAEGSKKKLEALTNSFENYMQQIGEVYNQTGFQADLSSLQDLVAEEAKTTS